MEEIAEMWLEADPTDVDLLESVRKMKNNRQPGEYGFVSEVRKCGGADLEDTLFNSVRTMWRRTREAHEGEEATNWPDEWKVGLVVQL